MTVREVANSMGVSVRRVMALIAESRLPGATKNEYGFWLIPAASVLARLKKKAHTKSQRGTQTKLERKA